MSASKETYQGMLVYVSLAVGTLFTAALLFQYHENTISLMMINMGAGIASWGHMRGYWPALLAASLVGGFVAMLVTSAIAPRMEEYVALAGKTRARKLMQTKEGMTVEEERKALIKQFGQSKPTA